MASVKTECYCCGDVEAKVVIELDGKIKDDIVPVIVDYVCPKCNQVVLWGAGKIKVDEI